MHFSIVGTIVLQLAGAVAPGHGVSRAPTAPDFNRVRATIKAVMARDSIPSLAIAVVKNAAILWEEGFGWTDTRHTVPTTPHTPYYLASVTKTITATAIMTLADRGALNIDHPANEYLRPGRRLKSPGPWASSSATVRHLLTHTSGLSTFSWSCFADQPGCRVPTTDTVIARYGLLMFPPGEHFDYTNLGFGVLGEIVSEVSRQPLQSALRQLVFTPVRMSDASLDVDSTRLTVTAPRVNRRGAHMTGTSAAAGASTAYASAHDLARFAMLHLEQLPPSPNLLRATTIRAMQTQTVPADNPSTVYGLGWWINPDLHGARALSAQGGTDDSYATVLLFPDSKVGVVLLANTGTTAVGAIIDQVLDELLPGYRNRRVADSAAAARTRQAASPPNASPSLVGAWQGSVVTPHGPIAINLVVDASGRARAQLGTGRDTALRSLRFSTLSNGVAYLSGRLTGDLATPEDIGPGPYDVYIELYRRGPQLIGLATSYPTAEAPFGARLSFPVMLATTSTQTSAVESVRRLDSTWAHAYQIHDTTFARKLMDSAFVMTSTNGTTKTREIELRDVAGTPGSPGPAYFRSADVEVHDFAPAVVVTGRLEWADGPNAPQTRRRYTATYVRGGPVGWRLVSLHVGASP